MFTANGLTVRRGIVSSSVIAVILFIGSAAGFWLNEKRVIAAITMSSTTDRYHLSHAFAAIAGGNEIGFDKATRFENIDKYCTAVTLNRRTLAAVDSRSITIKKAFRCLSPTNNAVVGGIVYASHSSGYSGPIAAILAFDAAQTLRYVKVLDHEETIGYGERLLKLNNLWLNGLLNQSAAYFNNQVFQDHARGGEKFDAISGATVTAQAMVQIIVQALSFNTAQSGFLNGSVDK